LTATIKGNLLENAVGQVHELSAVKAQAAQHKTQNGGIDLTYEHIALSCLQLHKNTLEAGLDLSEQRHPLQDAPSIIL
jgi:hypothetical protein